MEFLSIDKIRNVAEDAFNQAKPKTETEAKLYEVLSHKNWGSSSTVMNEIARDTYDYDKFGIISTVMWESMENQRPAAWRVVFKGLTLLEHLIKNGSERCVDDARNHGHSLRALQQFNYYEGTIDRGQGVREKSKQLIEMLGDDERVREERMKARKLREKFGGGNLGGVSGGNRGGYGGSGGGGGGYGNESSWDSGSSGYGNGGIDSRPKKSTSAYSGRYDNDRDTRSAAPAAGPTFATLPPATETKTKKKKKKKQIEDEPSNAPAAAPQADLLDFGGEDPAAAAAVPSLGGDGDGGFDDLRSAPNANDPFAADVTSSSDDFGAFDSAPASTHQSNNNNGYVQPFAAAPQQQSSIGGIGFDSFGGGGMGMNTGMANGVGMNTGMGMGINNNMGNMNTMMQLQSGMANMNIAANTTNSMMGGMPHQTNTSNMMGAGQGFQMQQQQAKPAAEDDEFGAFEAAAGGAAPGPASVSSKDPLSKLISLDGLSKNAPKTKPNKLSEPVSSGPAPAYGGGFDNFGSMGGGNFVNPGVGGMMGGSSVASSGSSIGMMDPSFMGMPGQQQKGMGAMGTGMQGGMNYNMQGGPGMGMGGMNGMMSSPMMGNGGMGMNLGMSGGMNPQMGMGGHMGGMNTNSQGVGMNMQQQSMMMNNPQQQMGMGGGTFGGNPMNQGGFQSSF
ncbi:hypothetical protein ACA910_019891 [Epithemia clementina (nom. ined.)]